MKRLNANACFLRNRANAQFEFHLSNLSELPPLREIGILFTDGKCLAFTLTNRQNG